MTFFAPDTLLRVTGGRWTQPPAAGAAARGVGIDTRSELAGRAFVAIKGCNHDGHNYLPQAADAGAALAIVDRDVPLDRVPRGFGVLRVEDTRRCLISMAAAYRRSLSATVIAVTGSAGKTTTRRLIHHVLSREWKGTEAAKSFNNDIGVPLTLLNASPGDRYVVVEIGTNGPGQIAPLATITRPDIAVITMVGRSHLEGLGTVEGVAREKASLLDHLKPPGVAIVHADSPELRVHVRTAPPPMLFGRAADAHLRLTGRGRGRDGWWFEVNGTARFRLSLPGGHNAVNALAAVAVGRHMGLTDARIDDGLASAESEAMRMTPLQVAGMTIYNDAYNANPDSTLASLATFTELADAAPRRVIVLGDMLELGPQTAELHREVGRRIVELDRHRPIAHVVMIGQHARATAEPLASSWPAARYSVISRLDQDSGTRVAELLQPGDAVLLKGSRGAALERLIDYLGQSSSTAATVPAR